MESLYLTSKVSEDRRRLTIAPLSSQKLTRCAEAPSDTSGHFLFDEPVDDDFGEIKILAQIQDNEAALRLAAMFEME